MPATHRAAIATPHWLATRAGEEALAAGGNAIDAALAAAITLTVVYPHNTAVGGDSVSMLKTPTGTRVLNATGPAPRAVRADELVLRHGEALPTHGVDTITVPGAVAAWDAIHRSGARLPWARHFDRAIEYAYDGVAVSGAVAKNIAAFGGRFSHAPGMAAIFAPSGTPLGIGDVFVQPSLGRSLEMIAAEGAAALYGGDVGRRLAEGLRAQGAALAVEDLAGYRPFFQTPLERYFDGYRIATSPPNTQGFLLLRALVGLERAGVDVSEALAGSAGVLARGFVEGNRLRDSYLGDPRYLEFTVAELIDGTSGPVDGAIAAGPLVPSGDTVGIVAADDEGNALAIVQSIFSGFGSGVLEESTGILMQNRGSSFRLSGANAIAPGRLPGHTLMPVMTFDRDGRLRWVNATMAGKGQPQVHVQLLLQLIAGSSVRAALRAPRWMVGARQPFEDPSTVYVEADLPTEAQRSLQLAQLKSEVVDPLTDWMGHMNVIEIDAAGGFTAESDPRSDGAGAVVSTPARGN
jgi:gamma-glutamyltranspeptidase/glutathione hydrolase